MTLLWCAYVLGCLTTCALILGFFALEISVVPEKVSRKKKRDEESRCVK